MEAPAVITADSVWYSEYIKHTESPEIQQLERQLAKSVAGQSSSTVSCDGQPMEHNAQSSQSVIVLQNKQLLMSNQRPALSADDIIRSTGVLADGSEWAALARRPATARSAPGGSSRGRSSSVPSRPPRPPRCLGSDSAGAVAGPAPAAAAAELAAACPPAVSGRGGRPAVYQDIMRSLGLQSDGGPTDTSTRSASATDVPRRPTPRSRPVPGVRTANGAPPTKQGKKVAPAARDDVTQRYLAFIDELIQEKQDLASRCEELVSQVTLLEERHKQQFTGLREKHRDEMQNTRRMISESERSKRQKWMEKEREKIKETTARAMQPQIEQMMRQHTEETARIKQHYETVLAGGHSGQMDEIRGRLVREKEEAVAAERREAGARYDRQVAELSSQHEAAVTRLAAETRELRTQLQTAGAAAAAQREDTQREVERRVRDARCQAEDEARETRRRMEDEVERKTRELRERLRQETEMALKQQKEELDTAASNRLQAEVQRLKEERDARLEEVIDRLEKEVRRAEDSEADRWAQKMRKLEEKHAQDLRSLECSEERFKAKYLDSRANLAEREEQLLELKSRIARKDAEISEMKQTAEILQQEQQQLGDVIEAEFKSQVVELRRGADRWQQRLTEAEHRHQSELADRQRQLDRCIEQRDLDLQQLHKQIKEAFSAKDQKIEELSASHQLSQKKVKQLENLLDKMRLVGCRCGGGGSGKI